MSIAEMTDRRTERATREFDRYAFQAVTLAGHPLVYVTAPAKPGRPHATYTVNVSAGRCSCPDFQNRGVLSGGQLPCKHLTMSAQFLACATPAPAAPPAPKPPAPVVSAADAEKIARRERSNRDVALWD
jgi:hypothetical protein